MRQTFADRARRIGVMEMPTVSGCKRGSERLEGGQCRNDLRRFAVRQMAQLRAEQLGALRLHPLVQLAAGRRHLKDDRTPVIWVRTSCDQVLVAELSDNARQHGRIDALELGEFAHSEWATAGNGSEHGQLARAQPEVDD